jgi:small subunit ribosomal protein S20
VAHSKSAEKRVRQNATRRLRNRSAKSAQRTSMKKLTAAIDAGDIETANALYRDTQKILDKNVSKGIIVKGTASRIKSRIAARMKRLQAAE